MIMFFLGILLVIIGLLMNWWCGTNYYVSSMDRAKIFRSNIASFFLVITSITLTLGGFFLVFKHSITVGFIFLGAVVFFFLWFKIESGRAIKSARKVMYNTYDSVRKAYLGSDINKRSSLELEKRILLDTWKLRYRLGGKHDIKFLKGKYNINLLKSVVDEYPNIKKLTDFVILFELYEAKHPNFSAEKLKEYAKNSLKTIEESNIDFDEYANQIINSTNVY